MRKAELEFMINYRIEQLVTFLMEDYNMPMLEAFGCVYNSRTYELLTRPETGFYFESPGYVYSYLTEEVEARNVKGT